MDLIHNERIKLLATFLNGIAIAIFAVGGLAPVFSTLYGTGTLDPFVTLNGAICLLAACLLHYLGSSVLKRIKT